VVASEAARPRLERKLTKQIAPLDQLAERLGGGVRLIEPAGTKTGEVWLEVALGGRLAWVVTDAFFNLATSLAGMIGHLLRATRTVPGLQLGRTFKWTGVKDARAYVASVTRELKRAAPTVLVPAHGDVLIDDALPSRLQQLLEQRL
jgi:hypothetical protein